MAEIVTPTGNFLQTLIPENLKLYDLTAGGSCIYLDFITKSTPEGIPTTCTGMAEDLEIAVDGTVLDWEAGFPQVIVFQCLAGRKVTVKFGSPYFDLSLFSKKVGNYFPNTETLGTQKWGIGAFGSTILPCKAMAYHRMLSGQYVWLFFWNIQGDGKFNIALKNREKFNQECTFNVNYCDTDFAGNPTIARDNETGVIAYDWSMFDIQISNIPYTN